MLGQMARSWVQKDILLNKKFKIKKHVQTKKKKIES